MSDTPEVEFSRPVDIETISEHAPVQRDVVANEAECVALATRFGVRALSDVKGYVTLTRETAGHAVKASGTFYAHVEQDCVVTLEGIETDLKGPIEAYYTDSEPLASIETDIEMPDEPDAPEYAADGVIDVGELVSQHIALAIDPYPRKEGVDFDEAKYTDEKVSPFAALAALKGSPEKD